MTRSMTLVKVGEGAITMPKCKKNYKNKELYAEYCRRHNRRYYQKTALYDKHRYTPDEDEKVLAHAITDTELSYQIEHSVMSIQIRCSRLLKRLERQNARTV